MTFKLHPVLQLFGPLRADRRQKLREEVKLGACPPVVLWRREDGIEYLIDGLPQAEICKELGTELPRTTFSASVDVTSAPYITTQTYLGVSALCSQRRRW
jgi:hypothetical protein